jgi:hypothetical protein
MICGTTATTKPGSDAEHPCYDIEKTQLLLLHKTPQSTGTLRAERIIIVHLHAMSPCGALCTPKAE